MTENEAIDFIRRYLDAECYTDKQARQLGVGGEVLAYIW